MQKFIESLDNIDKVIEIIKGSKDPTQAKEGLMDGFKLSEVQSQAILDMRLQKLTNLEQEKIFNEYKELINKIAELQNILDSKKLMMSSQS